MNDKYKSRCLKRLKEWGAPLEDWTCRQVVDTCEDEEDAVPMAKCELCGCEKVRFLHVMEHQDFYEELAVGCICAAVMEGDELAAIERDRRMKNRAKRRVNFVKHRWSRSYGRYYRIYQGHELWIIPRGDHYEVRCDRKFVSSYKGKPIVNTLSAIYAAFDLADPIEEVMHA